jgi:hypothetical protein
VDIIIAAMIAAMASEDGSENHTPSMPQMRGKNIEQRN